MDEFGLGNFISIAILYFSYNFHVIMMVTTQLDDQVHYRRGFITRISISTIMFENLFNSPYLIVHLFCPDLSLRERLQRHFASKSSHMCR
jgi:hypothetical protein